MQAWARGLSVLPFVSFRVNECKRNERDREKRQKETTKTATMKMRVPLWIAVDCAGVAGIGTW